MTNTGILNNDYRVSELCFQTVNCRIKAIFHCSIDTDWVNVECSRRLGEAHPNGPEVLWCYPEMDARHCKRSISFWSHKKLINRDLAVFVNIHTYYIHICKFNNMFNKINSFFYVWETDNMQLLIIYTFKIQKLLQSLIN